MSGRKQFPGITVILEQPIGSNTSSCTANAAEDEGGDRLDPGWVASVRQGARKTTTKSTHSTNGQDRNQAKAKEEPGTKWLVHPSLDRISKDGRPVSGTDLSIDKECPGRGGRTGNGRQQKPRGGDDPVARSQMVDFQGHNQRGSPPEWKKSIPEESVDPISLEPLCELDYPPFAIVADGPPYTPVFPGDWPPADPADETSEGEGRELAILRAQWGEQAVPKFQSEDSGDDKPLAGRRFNLFDGQILAFYLVSTLQFIDPYNRRDLTRDELRALDAYLSRHGLKRAGVVEAYDQKGEKKHLELKL